jgi:tetratricopeptide (TPR) repeat protein
MNRAANISTSSRSEILNYTQTGTGLQECPIIPASDEFSEEVAHAQSQLEKLRIRQQEIERQKAELEQLRKKQSDFQARRAEIIVDLEHALEVLERNHFQAEQRIENYARTRECFSHHLSIISSLRSEDWHREQLEIELGRGEISIEEARGEYDQALGNLDRLPRDIEEIHEPASGKTDSILAGNDRQGKLPPHQRNFLYWLRSGLAFTLPIMIFGIFSLVVIIFFN